MCVKVIVSVNGLTCVLKLLCLLKGLTCELK